MAFEEIFAISFLAIPLAFVLVILSIRIVNQYERGVLFRLGRFEGILEPGLNFIIPFVDRLDVLDVRTNVISIPQQETMSKDNVSVSIDAVIYYKVSDTKAAVLNVEYYAYATTMLAQTTLRDVVGETTLDELLTKRENTSKRVQEIVAKRAADWGVKIDAVEIKEIQLPGDLVRIMAKEAEAEREKRAVVIKASGELEAAKSLAQAAAELNAVPGGLHIRMLQTVNNLGNEKSKTKVITTPSEVMKAIIDYAGKR
ncbi:MAG: SPFH domain-containing protein [Candidatus Micrarchaeia archaeon]|jgi:regulator of protease activity HflC (stomatin/prohibitin superfamily)